MSVSGAFNATSPIHFHIPASAKQRKKRPAPFSLRLSMEERARLLAEAKGAPLGAYIKAKVLCNSLPVRARRTGLAVEDRKALAQTLALLGRSRLSSNLNQLAHAANIGALPVDPDTVAELNAALADVRETRRLLLAALGLKPEGHL
jgi:hypothetical protein